LALAAGTRLQQAEVDIGQVVEGVNAASAAHKLAKHLHVDLPITEQVYRILHEHLPPRVAVEALMARELKSEV
ncbi:MAG: NAD(P)H-dependent glycerol-3-phosphate dehydrogenase, partial [Gammaproteobacteria bacterium]